MVLWGSSFVAIKEVVSRVSPLTYVWVRAAIACAGLTPYLIWRLRRAGWRGLRPSLRAGVVTGVPFALGLWLQGWGTRYTSASNSAFITGLNVVFVHLYLGVVRRSYGVRHGAGLALSVAGLYLLTRPEGGFGPGDALVLAGAVAWAAQVLLVDKFSSSDPLTFTFGEMLPSTAFVVPDAALGNPSVPPELLPQLTYLGLACADAAFALQLLGQRRVDPASAAVIFLLEPVAAAFFAHLILGEAVPPASAAGMALILAAAAVTQSDVILAARGRRPSPSSRGS